MSDSAAWQQIGGPSGASFIDGRIVYDKATRDYLASNFCIPQTFMVGIDEAAYNERSKPMGLTKDHKYTDNDGDYIEVRKPHDWEDGGVVAVLEANDVDSDESATAYVNAVDSIPLALNVLGYDRPSAELNAAGPTAYNNHTAHTPIPLSKEWRDANVATAIDYLRGADIYDQRAAERKAAEVANEAEYKRLLEARDKANVELHEAAKRINTLGIYHVSLDGLTKALATRNETQAALDAHDAGV